MEGKFLSLPFRNKKTILALGAESAGAFSVWNSKTSADKNNLFLSGDFGDLLDEKNFTAFQKAVLSYLKKNKIKPDVVVADLHPLYKTTVWGRELAEKFGAKFVQVQHHVAHILSTLTDNLFREFSENPNYKIQIPNKSKIKNTKYEIMDTIYGVACDGTGYGFDDKIWGGEVVKITVERGTWNVERLGHLENQIMIGGDLAVREPARMLIAILAKIKNEKFKQEFRKRSVLKEDPPAGGDRGRSDLEEKFLGNKEFIYSFVKNFYAKNEFEVLYNQLQSGFNCIETSSTGRVLDAVAVLLGFAGNERKSKHEAAGLLEKASEGVEAYEDIDVEITKSKIQITNKTQNSNFKNEIVYELKTTPLFEYLIKNLHKDKKRLAATAQVYLVKGLFKILSEYQNQTTNYKLQNTFLGGGLANNKIMADYLASKGVYVSQKIPRGDAGISVGQVLWGLYNL